MTPKAGFQRFIGSVFEHPENRIVKKTNPNVAYSEIHVGDNEWELAPDREVLPVIAHHMTTAALECLNTFEASVKCMCENFRVFVRRVNEDDESREYTDTIDNMKYVIINMTRKLEAQNRNG